MDIKAAMDLLNWVLTYNYISNCQCTHQAWDKHSATRRDSRLVKAFSPALTLSSLRKSQSTSQQDLRALAPSACPSIMKDRLRLTRTNTSFRSRITRTRATWHRQSYEFKTTFICALLQSQANSSRLPPIYAPLLSSIGICSTQSSNSQTSIFQFTIINCHRQTRILSALPESAARTSITLLRTA